MARDILAEVGDRARRVELFDRAYAAAQKQLQEAQAKVESLARTCEKERKDLDDNRKKAADELKKDNPK
jgi:Skp family chaperone for outer membrane proteins